MRLSSCRKTSSGVPLILHYGELYNYFIIYYSVVIIEIKCTINVMHLNHPETILLSPAPHPWRNCLSQNWSLVPKRLGTGDPQYVILLLSKGPLPDITKIQNYDTGLWRKKELFTYCWVDLQVIGGTAQICLQNLESGQVLRMREKRVVCLMWQGKVWLEGFGNWPVMA